MKTQDATAKTSKKTPATKTPPITFHTGGRLKGRKKTEAEKKAAEQKRHDKDKERFYEQLGRVYSIGKVSKNGGMIWRARWHLLRDEADMLVEGTEFEVITPEMELNATTVKYSHRSVTRKLIGRLLKYQNQVVDSRWPEHCKGLYNTPLPKNRELDVWFVVHTSERLNKSLSLVTTNEQDVGHMIESYATRGMEVLAYRITVKVPTETSVPKPPRRKVTKPERLKMAR